VTDLLAGTMNFVVAIPSTLVGAFCGWVIGLTPFGALIGFVSGLFSIRWRSKDD
jgi:hypothetical protein